MMIGPSDNIALKSLQNHAQGGTFTVDITGDLEGEALARTFENLGCTVEPEPFSLQLRVTAPVKTEAPSPRMIA